MDGMSVPQISLTVRSTTEYASEASDTQPDIILVAARSTADGPALVALDGVVDTEAIEAQLRQVGSTGAKDGLVRLPAPAGTSIPLAVAGLGSTVDAASLRYAAGSALRQLAGQSTVAIAIATRSADELQALAEGAALGAYTFLDYRSASLGDHKPAVENVVVHHTGEHVADGSDEASHVTAHATAVAEAVSTVKNLVNTPPSDLYPETLAAAAVEAAAGLPIDVTVWDEEQLVADGFGGIMGVGQGSTRPPRLVKLSYSPAGAAKHLALVGKGITFDTGGLSLKPAGSMIGMKYDMAGAASVLAVIIAAARLELPVRLTSWMCIAENMPSGQAMRPDDILTIRGGTTVEINNTDAEGRLVLADGLVAASEEFPDAIVDIATLTGAQQVALGNRYSGLMGDDAFVAQVKAAADAVDEPMWPMPFAEELRKKLNSPIADLQNAKLGQTAGGMLLAGAFLREFIGDTEDGSGSIPWTHIDTAGPSNNTDAAYGFTGGGPTASGVRTLLKVAEEFSRP
jgi:leucyl aminopeptidase